MLIDLHTHSYPNSDDSFLSVETLIERSKLAGLDGICLTDHDYFWEPEVVRRIAAKHDFLVMQGAEVNAEDDHLLVFGLDSYEFGMHKAALVAEMVEESRGAMIVAHPYRRRYVEGLQRDQEAYSNLVRRTAREDVFGLIHGIEVANGRGTQEDNAFSVAVARELSTKGSGSSDSHEVADVGSFATEFESRIGGLGDLIMELRHGRFRPVTLGRRRGYSKREKTRAWTT